MNTPLVVSCWQIVYLVTATGMSGTITVED